MKKVESGHFLWVIAAAIVGGVFLGIAFGYGMGWGSGSMNNGATNRPITNFEECAAAGNAVMESYPRQCRANGQTYTEVVDGPIPVEPDGGIGDTPKGGCMPAGCSGQVCADAGEAGNIVTDCMFRAEYACYKTAKCERQVNGSCGWTQTSSLRACLSNPPPLQ